MKLFGIKITPALVVKVASVVIPAVAAVKGTVKDEKAKQKAGA